MSTNAQAPCSSGVPYRGCPACGTARSVKAQEDNTLKNRNQPPLANEVQPKTVDDLRNPAYDKKFYPDLAVEVTGYVAAVVPGAVKETANCRRTDLRDVIIALVASPTEVGNDRKYVVLEISPYWQKQLGFDDSNYSLMLKEVSKKLEGKWVTFRGWLFNDYIHIDEAESTYPGNRTNWRATTWEIHPVTDYKILSGPPSPSQNRNP
ncbi:MAG TPA: hypothetical protein VK582_15425 [Pyrinomonadaceae bacterium]|nr:hypothetical protein [Pyrinomonadaceae bacterium]